MKRVIAATACLLLLGAAPSQQTAPAPFRITVGKTSTGWEMHCDTGCAWARVALECRNSCRAVVDDSGISTEMAAPVRETGFAFVIERTVDGFVARSRRGTTWERLAWSCHFRTCSARVTETGVSGI